MKILDWLLFLVFSINVVYLFVFALASRLPKKKYFPKAEEKKSIAVLIPSYKEDAVIEESVESCLKQDYPAEKFTIVVISDHMEDSTNERLSLKPIVLIKASYENSTKAKALNLAMSKIRDHDIAVVFDADNTVDENFLSAINNSFADEKTFIIQAHRTAKNVNNNMAVLDAISEESNNSIFRQGHANLGLSAALIGSGMAFDYLMFKNKMLSINSVGGFDRNLELSFLKDGKKIEYLSDLYVYDEKVQSQKTFSNQRKRWLSAQLHYFVDFRKDLPKAIMKGNIDFCNKYFQQVAIPRIILLGLVTLIAVLFTFISVSIALKWWIILLILLISLGLAIPINMINRKLFRALVDVPKIFLAMFINLFKLKNANKSFIHTPHGVTDKTT